jgi:HNH endonuclease
MECQRLTDRALRARRGQRLTPMDDATLARFAAKIAQNPETGCWLWQGAVRNPDTQDGGGYSRFWTGTHVDYAHRVSFVHFRGPIPPDKEIDHRCQTRACVNPEHLDLVDHTTNMRRGPNATKTHCKRGHEFTPENTRVVHHKRGWVLRECRECRRMFGHTPRAA